MIGCWWLLLLILVGSQLPLARALSAQTFSAQAATAQAPESGSPPPASTQPTSPPPKGLIVRPGDAAADPADRNRRARRISVDVVVRGSADEPVAGLSPADFQVLDNRKPAKLVAFRSEDSTTKWPNPVQVVLVLDALNNTFENVASERGEIQKFLRRDGGRLPVPVSIVLLSTAGTLVDQPTVDGNLLAQELAKTVTARPTGAVMGSLGAIERFKLSLKVMNQLIDYEKPRPGRKLLIWIGPGWPMLAGDGFGSSAKDQLSNWDQIVSFSGDLREARIVLYSLNSFVFESGLGRADLYREFLKSVTARKDAAPGDLAVQVLAIESGGKVLNGTRGLASEIAACLTDARPYYTLTFESSPAAEVNEYRPLEVKVSGPGLTARTTTGYYAQP